MAEEIILQTVKLKKTYNFQMPNEFEALHGIDFEVKKGEFIGIMGPSGSGKSTFLNNISTLDRPTGGKVLINGKDIITMSDGETARFRFQNLGYVFQYFNLLKTHTIYENIALPLSLNHVNEKETEQKVNEIAEELGIRSLLDRYPGECSGGQRQRAAICRALINHPTILVADEPTGNLDSINSRQVLKILRKLNTEHGTTIIMVSHDPMIVSYTSGFVYLKDGQIESRTERGKLSQREYYHRILEISSSEAEDFLE